MIYLQLFLTFLKIGAVSFGGGYGMISLIREDCLANASSLGYSDADVAELYSVLGVDPVAMN